MKSSLWPVVLAMTLIAGCASPSSRTVRTDYTALVDTRIGTESRFELSYGNTYPATGRTFGMNLWAPQTGAHGDGWKYTWQSNEMRSIRCIEHMNRAKFITPFVGGQLDICEAFCFKIPDHAAFFYKSIELFEGVLYCPTVRPYLISVNWRASLS